MKVALVYDRVNKWGGAERVLLRLHDLFPEAPLYTAVYNPETAAWAKPFRVKPSYLQSMPFARQAHEYYPLFMPSAFEQFDFDAYDVVISVTSEAAKGIITKPNTRHICYCLTPTRYLWSGYEEYFSSAAFQLLSRPAVSYLRAWDRIAAHRPDRMIAISQEVKRRISTYYRREADVIYPPLTFPRISQKTGDKKQEKKKRNMPTDFYLLVSRLVPYKHVDLAIRACNALQLPLYIVGTGSEEERLKRMAGPTVTFLGVLTDEVLAEYYDQCTALLFPGEEDFGLTVIEAASFGKPVIAYKKGGAQETVLEGKTGSFFSSPTAEALKRVLRDFDPGQFQKHVIMKHAERFGGARFDKEVLSVIEQLI